MELMRAIRHRRAIREFSGERVEDAAIERLIDAATRAPSAVNKQPWLFTVIRDRAMLDRISAESKKHMLHMDTASQEFHALLSDPQFHVFYHAPLLVVISAIRDDHWVKEDAALAAENLMLAAFAEGLGSCWIGFAQRWLETSEGQSLIEVPDSYQPVAPIILGHPKGHVPNIPRKRPQINWIG